ncbi:MAG: hypothetical protein IPJ30_11665 [Acidobacteria bacterium]|nr:hypothetical protein [Acidobacteriota bacterium]
MFITFKISGFQRFQDSRIPGSKDSRIPRISRFQGFQDSRIPGFEDSRPGIPNRVSIASSRYHLR